MDETETCWHLLVITEGGKVSILKNLDAPTARQSYQRLQPGTRPREYINEKERRSGGFSSGFHSISAGDIRNVHILGPEGVELDPWRGAEPIVIDLARQEWA